MKKSKLVISFFILVLLQAFLFSSVAQQLHVFKSEYLPANDSVYVFIPINYNMSYKTFPVVYMLHGYGGNYQTWNKIISLQEYSNRYDFIIVCPDGLYDCWYVNSPVNSELQFENFFFNKLYTYINENYKTDKKNVFITGLSMGGYGSLYLYANNTNKFKAVGSTSGLLDLLPYEQHYGISKVFGNSNTKKQNYIDFSIFNFIEKFKKSEYHIIIDCGTEDPFYYQNLQFFEKCSTSDVNISFTYRPGNHIRQYWEESIKDHFQYFYYLSKKVK